MLSLPAALDLGGSEIPITIIDRLELATVDGHHRFCKQIQLPTDIANRFAIVFAKIGNGLEIRHQATAEPHQLDVPLDFVPSGGWTGLDCRVIRRPAGRRWIDAFKSQFAEIKLIDEDINYSDWIVLGDVVIETFGEQGALVRLSP